MAVSVFTSYSHEDEELMSKLATHLSVLEQQQLIDVWNDRKMLAGDQIDKNKNEKLDSADIILLLLSPDFFDSASCRSEMDRALDRIRYGKVRIISVILRQCDWKHTALGLLLALPKDGLPIMNWENIDDAFYDVAKSIRNVINEIIQADTGNTFDDSGNQPTPKVESDPQSEPTNLHLRNESVNDEEDDLHSLMKKYVRSLSKEIFQLTIGSSFNNRK